MELITTNDCIMELTIPTVLKSFATSGAAVKSINTWWKKSKGDARALIGELKENLIYLDMVAEDGVPLSELVEKLCISEYKRLSREGFNFNKLKRSRIARYPSLRQSDLANWTGKETAQLIESIYEKLNDMKLRYPHLSNNEKYRWGTRVNNIRKRIWLLLKHVND